LIRARCAMRRTVAESTDMGFPLGLWLKRAGYSTVALAQAMRDGAPHAEEIAKRSSRSTQRWVFAQSYQNVSA
jgi:hypothetical protein